MLEVFKCGVIFVGVVFLRVLMGLCWCSNVFEWGCVGGVLMCLIALCCFNGVGILIALCCCVGVLMALCR